MQRIFYTCDRCGEPIEVPDLFNLHLFKSDILKVAKKFRTTSEDLCVYETLDDNICIDLCPICYYKIIETLI